MRLPAVRVEEFKYGVVTRFENKTAPRGSASDALNWISQGDHIELRGGQARTGSAVTGSASPVTGLRSGVRFNGDAVLFYTYDRKINYVDPDDLETTIEAGSDAIAADASGEEMALETYHSLAGAFLYISSPASSFYKIPLANPGSVVDQSVTNHRGRFRIKQNRTMLWHRQGTNNIIDASGIYGSYIDKDELSDYTQVTGENVGTGDGGTLTFADTLSAVTGARTCHYIVVTDGTETFNDDRNGILVGSAGGAGTINYATGAISVTFAVAPLNLQAITCDYYWENSTSGGILDFSKSAPRTAGQGFVFRQDDGGAAFQAMGTIDDDEFCFHSRKTWRVTLSSDDTNATNLIFRSNVGTPNWRALAESGDGLYYVDAIKSDDAYIRLLVPSQFADNKELPKSISDLFSLTPYRFDKAAMLEWGNYIIVACRTSNSSINNRALFFNKLYESWDITDIRASVLDEYNGTLVVGDSGAPNLYTVFSGLTDDDVEINNYWISNNDDLDNPGTKVTNWMVVSGLIDTDQDIEVYLSLDGGAFILAKTIQGTGAYVSQGQSIAIGSPTVGTSKIGGGETGLTSHPYEVEFKINTAKFKRIRVKFMATKVGVATVSSYEYKDIRFKGRVGVPSMISA